MTKPERTLIDIASVVTSLQLEVALDAALRSGVARIDRLVERMESLAHRRPKGIDRLRRLLVPRNGLAIPANEFETRLYRALRDLGSPTPVAQYEIHDGGHLVARVDFAYPNLKIAIEADSRLHHSQPADWERDLARRNRLTALGWLVIHVSWRELHERPHDLRKSIMRAIGSRGSS